ncbi:MAG: peptidyl-prolyl cis-trans isomerase [Myxococcales bacterium]|nr:peptidyl-prolyl cis-trans isomerase [Myxococcales bacterium]
MGTRNGHDAARPSLPGRPHRELLEVARPILRFSLRGPFARGPLAAAGAGSRLWLQLLGAAAIAATAIGGVAVADTALAGAREDRVVAVIGEQTLTVGGVERMLKLVPAFRLRALGPTPLAIRRAVVEELIDLELLVQGALKERLDQREDVQTRVRAVLVQSLENRLRAEALASVLVTDEAVKAYYAQHADRYRAELRLKLWQIAVDKREDAEKLLDTIKNDKAFAKDPILGWETLAANHSTDKSTAMKFGNLGFVRPDGTTKDKQLKVSPALYQAAAKVADGEVVPAPIEDGGRWLLVQRRGSVETPERPLESEAASIRAMLSKQAVGTKLDATLAALRKQHVTELYEIRIDDVDIDTQGNLAPQRRPGTFPPPKRAERPGPPLGDPHEHR